MLSNGASFQKTFASWYRVEVTSGISISRWILRANHPQLLLEVKNGYLLGVFGEVNQEFRIYSAWRAGTYVRIDYPELWVRNLFLQMGLSIAYDL